MPFSERCHDEPAGKIPPQHEIFDHGGQSNSRMPATLDQGGQSNSQMPVTAVHRKIDLYRCESMQTQERSWTNIYNSLSGGVAVSPHSSFTRGPPSPKGTQHGRVGSSCPSSPHLSPAPFGKLCVGFLNFPNGAGRMATTEFYFSGRAD